MALEPIDEGLTPNTREEMFLAKAAGKNVETPTPITRREVFLSKIPGGSGGGSASIDVTAQVGQTIVVEEVDGNGKPTKWKAADYQPRTHWTEETVILPETTVECVEVDADEDGTLDGICMGVLPEELSLNSDTEYVVVYNGTKYSCKSVEVGQSGNVRVVYLGNMGALGGGASTGEPFVMGFTYYPDEGYAENLLMTFDGSATVILSIIESKGVTIPMKFIPVQDIFRQSLVIEGWRDPTATRQIRLVGNVAAILAEWLGERSFSNIPIIFRLFDADPSSQSINSYDDFSLSRYSFGAFVFTNTSYNVGGSVLIHEYVTIYDGTVLEHYKGTTSCAYEDIT